MQSVTVTVHLQIDYVNTAMSVITENVCFQRYPTQIETMASFFLADSRCIRGAPVCMCECVSAFFLVCVCVRVRAI